MNFSQKKSHGRKWAWPPWIFPKDKWIFYLSSVQFFYIPSRNISCTQTFIRNLFTDHPTFCLYNNSLTNVLKYYWLSRCLMITRKKYPLGYFLLEKYLLRYFLQQVPRSIIFRQPMSCLWHILWGILWPTTGNKHFCKILNRFLVTGRQIYWFLWKSTNFRC